MGTPRWGDNDTKLVVVKMNLGYRFFGQKCTRVKIGEK